MDIGQGQLRWCCSGVATGHNWPRKIGPRWKGRAFKLVADKEGQPNTLLHQHQAPPFFFEDLNRLAVNASMYRPSETQKSASFFFFETVLHTVVSYVVNEHRFRIREQSHIPRNQSTDSSQAIVVREQSKIDLAQPQIASLICEALRS